MYSIENDHIKVEVNSKGAELNSIWSKETLLEYLWSGDPAFWGKKSPVLFPIVGALKNNTYHHNNKSYTLGRHGFARDMEFVVTDQQKNSLVFTLTSNEDTLNKYPFPFRLDIKYTISGSTLSVQYRVLNTGIENMYFSIGAHPAFKVPLEKEFQYEDHYFKFSQAETAQRWLISSEGLIEPLPVHLLDDTDILPLSRELFGRDAVVFKYLNSTGIKLVNDTSPHGLDFNFEDFPFLGLWAAPKAAFVCIEPWCGIADSTETDQQLINKEGIHLLVPEQDFARSWNVSVY